MIPMAMPEYIAERVRRAEVEPDADGPTVDLKTGAGALPCPGPPGAGWRCIHQPWHLGRCTPWSESPMNPYREEEPRC